MNKKTILIGIFFLIGLSSAMALNMTVISPTAVNYSTSSIVFNVTSESNFSLCEYTLDDWATNITMTVFNTTSYYNRTILSDGDYTVKFWCNDTDNSINDTTTVNFGVDINNPFVKMASPNNMTNTTNKNININITISDIHLQACWWTNNTGINNYSLTCGNNITGQLWKEGTTTVYVYANDSVGHINSTSVTFLVDTIKPTYINFTKPTLATNAKININSFVVNVTATDVNLKNLTVNVYNSASTLVNSTTTTSSSLYINYSNMANGVYYFNATVADVANNINNSETRTITLDTIKPGVLVYNPLDDYSSSSARTVSFEYNCTDLRLANATFTVNGVVNRTFTSITTGEKNIFNVAFLNGNYDWNITCTDTSNNQNISSTRSFAINVETSGSGGSRGGCYDLGTYCEYDTTCCSQKCYNNECVDDIPLMSTENMDNDTQSANSNNIKKTDKKLNGYVIGIVLLIIFGILLFKNKNKGS